MGFISSYTIYKFFLFSFKIHFQGSNLKCLYTLYKIYPGNFFLQYSYRCLKKQAKGVYILYTTYKFFCFLFKIHFQGSNLKCLYTLYKILPWNFLLETFYLNFN